MLANLALILIVSLSWAAGYLFVEVTDHGLPPITDTAAMAMVAALVMLPGARFALRRPLLDTLRRRPWVPLLMGLTAVAVPNLAVVVAERTVPADLAAVLGATVPVATLLLTAFLTRETRLSPPRVVGVLLAVVGLVIFTGGVDLLANEAELVDVAVMMAGGVVFAVNGLLVRRQTADLDDVSLATWTMVFGALALAAAAFLLEEPLAVEVEGRAMAALVAEGVLSLGVAYLVYYALVARAGAWFASLYAFLVPPLGVLLVALTLDHPLTADHVAGVLVVVLGLLLITRRPASTAG